MIDDKTPGLQLPLPHEQNLLEDDVLRLRAALAALDVDATLKQAAILAAQQVADEALATALAAGGAANAGLEAAATALIAHNEAPDAHPNMQTLPGQEGHAGEMLTTDGTSASWSAVPKTDWTSISGKPEISLDATPGAIPCRDAEGRLAGNITGTAVYA